MPYIISLQLCMWKVLCLHVQEEDKVEDCREEGLDYTAVTLELVKVVKKIGWLS